MPEDNEIDEILNELKQKDNEGVISSGDEPEDVELSFSDDSELPEEIDTEEEEPADFELVDETLTAESNGVVDGYEPEAVPSSKNKIIIAVVAVLLVVAVAVGVFAFVKSKNKEPETTTSTTVSTTVTTTKAPVIYRNPFTNEVDYNKDAIGKRCVAVVVENAEAARPQWGIDDKTSSPDIIIEGEVEGGESRMLWLFADYTSLPDQIGPIRSARPPFIKFSELFDSVFIHWGQSQSKGDYVGADSVFSNDGVDHINQMSFNDSVGLFGRDNSRGVASEHTGVLYGSNMAAAIEKSGFRTEANESKVTAFKFNDEDKTVGETACTSVYLKYSSRSRSKTWTYDSQDKLYHTGDYKNDTTRKNILILYDTTYYVVKSNYKGSGNSETYCNYSLSGGTGKLASLGTVVDIKWSVENGQLVIRDSEGKEVSLNSGKTWIGWASSNNGGYDTVE